LVAGNSVSPLSGDSTATVRGAEAGAPAPVPTERFSMESLIRPFREGSGGRLLAYMVAVQAAVQISGPYFTPYMLRKLEMSYTDFVILIAVSFLAKVLSLKLWGRFAQRLGAHRLLWLGSLGIIPVAGLWIISSTFPWLIFVQAAGGVVWAAWELAVLLLFFESIPRAQRTHVLTVFNLANATAWILGAMLGAAVLKGFGPAKETYYLLFVLSSLFRLSAILLLKRIPEIRVMKGFIPTRTVAIRPTSGTVDRPILAEDEGPAAAVAPLALAAVSTNATHPLAASLVASVDGQSEQEPTLSQELAESMIGSERRSEAVYSADLSDIPSTSSNKRSLIACPTSSSD